MSKEFKKVGVIGAGVMGAQLAALFAGAGCDVELMDIVPQGVLKDADVRIRNGLASSAIARLAAARPPPLYTRADTSRIRPGNLEDHLERLRDCDWVIEAITERMDIKRALYTRLALVIGKDTIFTSNTSGLLRRTLTKDMVPALSQRFFITHFFNPPRYMKLLEIVGVGADASAVEAVVGFASDRLGKGIVRAKDTPLFVANRIGMFYVLDTIHRVVEQGWPIEAVDVVLGRATGRPKSGVFRTLDIAGLDTLTYVAAELVKGCPKDEGIDRCRIPQFVQQMVVKGLVGEKAGRGFYFKDRTTGQIVSFDPSQFDYRPHITFNTPSLAEAQRIEDPAERIRHVVFAKDQAGEIAWPVISRALVYTANRIPEIADDIVTIDRAMRWGYNWELGPFETWDALGVREVSDRLDKEGVAVPRLVSELLDGGRTHFYEWRGHHRMYFDIAKRGFEAIAGSDDRISLARLKAVGRQVDQNAGASLIDVGDGVFACEFLTKMNAIDGDIIKMLHTSIDRVEKEGVGLLIYNEGEQFSVGANLLLVLIAAQQKRWGEIDAMVREFQSANQRIRFSAKPVLAVPFGMTLGGGCEMCLAAPRRVASVETYIGLVEVGAGVIPAGGGCKNMLLNLEKYVSALGPQPKVNTAFELIATARVSTSAREAAELGLLSRDDRIVMDRELLLRDARRMVVELAKDYRPPTVRHDILLPGRGGEMALVNALRSFRAKGVATEYDTFIASKLAHILSGGDCPTIHETSENHILDLERETFLSLVGEQKTQERMTHILKTGKPLRN